MECKVCGSQMYIGPSGFKSDEGTTEVKLVQTHYCPSNQCSMYKKLVQIELEAPKPPITTE